MTDHMHHHHASHVAPRELVAAQGHAGHADMVLDFQRRFWVSLALTAPVVATSHMIQALLKLRGALPFPGDEYVGFGFASAVYFYGGWPFLTGLVAELRKRL